jgi:Cys-rich four helix bundle protein (predicted Tat secretion target)
MLNRRDLFVVGASAAAASITSALVACADKKKPAPAAAPTAGSAATAPAAASAPAGTNRHPEFVAAAARCVAAGEVCIAHCIEALATDNMLAACAKAVHPMLAVCSMIGALAAADSAHLAKAAALCDAVCKDCKEQCDKHAGMHAECKACADACGEMLAQIAKLG